MLFSFLSRVVITRFYTPSDYGMFNLYFTILSIFTAIGSIGLKNGIQRNISFYLGKDEKEKVPAIIGWGLVIGLAGGMIFAIGLFLFSDLIASLFSDDPRLGYYFKIAAMAVPSFVITTAMVSVFRGFQRTKERILFFNLGRNILILGFVIVIGLLALPFHTVILSVSISIILLSIIFFIYYLKNKKELLGIKRAFKWDIKTGKKLLIFSLPLLLVDILYRVMGWADTMIIGYFLAEDFVGFYNVARPLSNFISQGLVITTFIYSPLVAMLYAQDKFKENETIYIIITKWVSFLMLPLALVFIFFPEIVIINSFGEGYTAAKTPLQILSIIYFIKILMGPNGSTLTAYGKTRFLMYATLAAASLNVLLNLYLIPLYGITGAATATGVSIIGMNSVRVWKVNKISNIHSLKSKNLKPILISIVISTMLSLILKRMISVNFYISSMMFIIYLIIIFLSMILTKSITKEDIKVLLLVEKRIGIDMTKIKRVLDKFI